MRKLFTLLFMVVVCSMFTAKGQTTDIIISEYIDGSTGNQAIEIFNGTGAPVDLSNYVLKLSNNGDGWAINTLLEPAAVDSIYILPLKHVTLANDSVYVICNSAATGVGFTDRVDLYLTTTNTTAGSMLVSFDGNDAIGLFKDDVLIDVVGQETGLGATSFNAAGCTDPTPAGEDHTLIRKSTIISGNIDWTASAGTTAEDSEWIVYPIDDASNLGDHILFLRGTDILAFTLTQQTKEAVIDAAAHTVSAEIGHTDILTALTPIITISEGASISPDSGAEVDFTNPVVYTVTSEAGTSQDWTVTVLNQKETDATLSSIMIDDISVENFSSTKLNYAKIYPAGTSLVPIVSATSTDENASIVITQSGSIYGVAKIVVTAEDVNYTKIYRVYFGTDPGTDLIISEYIDGSSSHQALEIFNGTGATINLKNYTMKLSSAGAGWAWNTSLIPAAIDSLYILPLGNIDLPNDSVYVICNNSATKVGFRDHVDLFLSTVNTTAGSKLVAYNGNDAIGLFKNDTLIDVVGPEFADPLWWDPEDGEFDAPYFDVADVIAAGADHTLVRKPTSLKGNPDWFGSAGNTALNSEWIVRAKNDASNLGIHYVYSTKTDILSFTLIEQSKPAVIDYEAHTVSIEVVYGTPVTALTPVITVSPFAQYTPTGSQDFTSPVDFTVNAEYPGYSQIWVVTVSTGSEPSHDANIISLTIPSENQPAEINAIDSKITAHMAYNADLTALTPEITVSIGATIDISGQQDFTNPVVYRVTAQDNTTYKDWEVTVVNDPEPNHEAEILTFELAELYEPVTINSEEGTIKGMLKASTLPTNLTPIMTLSPNANVSPTIGQNFTNPVVYTVTAEDGVVVKTWTVTLTIKYTPIYDIQFTTDLTGDSPIKNAFVRTKGVVTGITSNSFFMQDGTGAWNGIKVKTTIPPTVSVGDSVAVNGTVKEDANLTIITNPSLLVSKLNSGNQIPNASIVAFENFNEPYEGVLTSIENVTCTDTSTMTLYQEWQIKVGSITIYVDDDIYFRRAALNQVFTKITGIGTYYLGYFRLLPRGNDDMVTSVGEDILGQISVFPNPCTNNLIIKNITGVSRVLISNILGQTFYVFDVHQAEQRVDVSNLTSGIYIITLINDNGDKVSKRVVKM